MTDAAGERDLYAAWNAIFEQTQPTRFETATGPSDRGPAPQERSAPRPSGESAVHGVAGDVLRVREPMSRAPAPTSASDSGFSPLPPRARTTPTVDVEPMPNASIATVESASDIETMRQASVATIESVSDVALRVHFVRALSAPPDHEPQPEVVSIVLDGGEVSIIVRDTGLGEAEALRTAFGTARELTGRPESLQQLTLNGRVLYQQASLVDGPDVDVLFSC